ncbi:MAG: hypothetical protein BWY72_00967 [Bacteroidetes bacterium ADurb.Bin416]|nr:MAG: hypothetical protein BWY72_00967 [Bacteroidetes bacterium ADurb.Bin416]
MIQGGPFRAGTQHGSVTIAMCFSNRVTAGCQGNGFFVVHGHAFERGPHVLGCTQGVGFAIHTFGVDIDQPHLYGGEGVFKGFALVVVGVALFGGGQPFLFSAPVDVFLRVPDVFPSTAETEGFEAHGFVGHVAGQDEQVGPGEFVAVFFLDGPQQAAGFVEVDVVRPAVEGGEALVACVAAAAPIGCAVGAGAVPGHADHQPAIMAPIGRPPFLTIPHQGFQIVFYSVQV